MSKKKDSVQRRRQVQRARRGTGPVQRPKAPPPAPKQDDNKRKMSDLWISLGIVALVIVLVFVAYRLSRRPSTSADAVPTGTIAPAAALGGTVEATVETASTAQATAESASTPVEDTSVTKSWSQPPAMSLDANVDYQAIIKTVKGDIVINLFEDEAPNTVNNFVFLARQGFYDGVTFHRVLAGFMAQTGDPTGTGTGGPGYRFADEFSPSLRHDSEGIVSMANSGANTNGSQFFITYAPQTHLNDKHSVFGKVIEGMDVLRLLALRDPTVRPTPPPGDKILTIEIVEK